MSKLIFMNTFDAFTLHQDRIKYGGTVNRSRPYATSKDIVLCLQEPTQRYKEAHRHIQHQNMLEATYIPILPESNYSTDTKLLHQIEHAMKDTEIERTIMSFMVTENLEKLAQVLSLEVEATAQSKQLGNDKRTLFNLLPGSNLQTHLMEGEVFQLHEGYASFKRVCKKYAEEENIVRCKYPISISGNGVFQIYTDNEEHMREIRRNVLLSGKAGPGFPDGEVVIQRNIPDIIGFYNVMASTDISGFSKVKGAGVTKQKMSGNSHIGNSTDLSFCYKGTTLSLPEEIKKKIEMIAIQTSEVYFRGTGSTGHSGIDFAISYDGNIFTIRIMEVNDRINGCYPLHYLVDNKVIPHDNALLLETTSHVWGIEKEEEFFNNLYSPSSPEQGGVIPLSNSGSSYQALHIHHVK